MLVVSNSVLCGVKITYNSHMPVYIYLCGVRTPNGRDKCARAFEQKEIIKGQTPARSALFRRPNHLRELEATIQYRVSSLGGRVGSREKRHQVDSSATSVAPDTRGREGLHLIRIRDIEHGGEIVSWGAAFLRPRRKNPANYETGKINVKGCGA